MTEKAGSEKVGIEEAGNLEAGIEEAGYVEAPNEEAEYEKGTMKCRGREEEGMIKRRNGS